MTHELGHAKDSGSYNSRYLFQLLSSEKAGLNDRYFLVSPEEFYAEFFKDYAIVQAHIEKQLNKNYGEILNKMPESHRQKFIQEVAIMKITGENETVSSILERAGLEQYKNLFNEDIDKKIDASLPNSGNNYELISHLSLIYKCSKKNSEIRKEFNKFIRDISNEYNSPKKAKKLMGV